MDFLADTTIFDIARAVHGEGWWRDQDIGIGCLMSTRDHLVTIEREHEEVRIQRGEIKQMKSELWAKEQESKVELNEKTLQAKDQFAAYKVQMNDLTRRVTKQLDLLEVVHRTAEQEMLQRTQTNSALDIGPGGKITKLPVFPAFSGEEPTPKDERGIETFLFQIKGVKKMSLTKQLGQHFSPP